MMRVIRKQSQNSDRATHAKFCSITEKLGGQTGRTYLDFEPHRWRDTMRYVLAVACLLMFLAQPLSAGPLIWSDEFNGQTLSDRWTNGRYWWDGDISPGGGEEQVYHPSAATVRDGNLQLTATRDPRVSDFDGETYEYTSGLVTTGGVDGRSQPGFTFLYGTVEARIKVPKGQGIWPAFWTLTGPIDGRYSDERGEIDILELIGQRPERVEMHLHGDDFEVGDSWDSGVDMSLDFHTYAVDWQPGEIRWMVDGVERFRYGGPEVPSVPMYLLFNVAVGGHWPGSPDESTEFPATMLVDYVRVYSPIPEPAGAAAVVAASALLRRRRW
jgi:beta-glucanase (GH16 family)